MAPSHAATDSGPEGERGGVPAPAGRIRRAWLAWRRWRRTRPFWGGLLVLLGSAEMLLSEKAPLPVIVHIGFLGLAGYLIPLVLLLCALLLWFNPVQRTFYSILAVLLSLGSWITTNLGGFFVGMLLGLIGGSLAFAWERSGGVPAPERPTRPITPQDTPSPGLGLILGDTEPGGLASRPSDDRRNDAEAGGNGPDQGDAGARAPETGARAREAGARTPGTDEQSRSGRISWETGRTSWEGSGFLAVPAAPLLLATFVVLAHHGPLAGGPPGAGSAAGPALARTEATHGAASRCPPATLGPDPTGSPSPTTRPSPGRSTASPSPTARQSPGRSTGATVSPSSTRSLRPTGSPSPTTSLTPTRSPTPARSPAPKRHRRRDRCVPVAASPAVRASSARSSITAGSAVLTGLSFDGVAKVATASGTVRMLKFTMSSLTLSGGTVLTVAQAGHSFAARDSSLAFSGNVVLYTTRFSGDLAGIRVTFTPQKPPPAVLPDMTFTSMVADQPYTTAGSLQASDLKITAS